MLVAVLVKVGVTDGVSDFVGSIYSVSEGTGVLGMALAVSDGVIGIGDLVQVGGN